MLLGILAQMTHRSPRYQPHGEGEEDGAVCDCMSQGAQGHIPVPIQGKADVYMGH